MKPEGAKRPRMRVRSLRERSDQECECEACGSEAKRLSRLTGLTFFAFLCVSEHFDLNGTHFISKIFVSLNRKMCMSKASKKKGKDGGNEHAENASVKPEGTKHKARGSKVTVCVINASAKH